MKQILALCCFYLAFLQPVLSQNQALKAFWNDVYLRYHYKEMTAGMSSWMYRIAENQTGKYSEAKAMLDNMKYDTAYQTKVFFTAYIQENANKENLRLIFANMCGSFSVGNPVVDYVCSRYSNDPLAKRIIAQKREKAKNIKKEEEIKDSIVSTSDIGQPEIKIQDAEFPGGNSAYQRFLANNLKIPDSAVGISGIVVVEFTIDSTGKVRDAKIISQPLGHGLESEVLRVISLLPVWTPARKSNVLINTKRQQTFSF